MKVCVECGQSFAPPAAAQCTCGGQLRDRGVDQLLGQTLGSYRIAKLLGEGGMGLVYKGVHPEIGSRVAIKVLSRDVASSSEAVERFFAEAKAANLIRHDNIINILDLAMLDDGRPYIIMEYLDGASLGSILEEQRTLPLGSLARLAGEVLDALGAAHAAPIVHRDLKPDNIFVSPQGRAKVLDFGIAKLRPDLSGRSGPTRTGSLMGTPHYMAPEQATATGVDTRADIYSMGVILYEAATGTRPFVGESLYEILRQHVEATPQPPAALRPGMPPAYAHVILRAMAKDPAMRFQSAAEMKAALATASHELPEVEWRTIVPGAATPVSQPTPSGQPPSQPPWPGPTPQATPSPHHGHPHHAPGGHGSHPGAHRVTAHPRHPPGRTGTKSRTGLYIGLAVAVAAIVGLAIVAQQSPGSNKEGGARASASPDVSGQQSSTGNPAGGRAVTEQARGPAAGGSSGQSGDSDAPQADPETQLATKLDDIVGCADDGGSYRSKARYLDWVDAERGPTGDERYISYGLYTMSDPEDCAENIAEMIKLPPSMPELEKSLQELSAAISQLAPMVNEAAEYYDQEDYKDDGAKKGKELHPKMMKGFAAVEKAHIAAEKLLVAALDDLADREMKRAQEAGNQLVFTGMKLVREARDLTDLFKPMVPGKLETLDLDAYSDQLDRYLAALEELEKALAAEKSKGERDDFDDLLDDGESLVDAGKGIAKHAKLLRRRARKNQKVDEHQREWLGTSAGWMVEGSPDAVMNAYEELVRGPSMPQFSKRVLKWEVEDSRYYRQR